MKHVVESRSDELTAVIGLGDIHRGSGGLVERLFYKARDRAKELGATVIGMGDYGECITRSDKRHDLSSFDYRYLTPDKQYEQSAMDLEGLNPCAVLAGNHEDAAWRMHDHNYASWLAKELKSRYCPDFAYIRLSIERRAGGKKSTTSSLNILAHHGYSNARTPGYKVKVIHDMGNVVTGRNAPDVFLMGHTHTLGEAFPTTHLYISDAMELREFTQHYYYTGSFVKAYEPEAGIVSMEQFSSYAAKKGYPPTSLGCPIIWVKPNRVDDKKHSMLPPFSVRYETLDWEPPSDFGEDAEVKNPKR